MLNKLTAILAECDLLQSEIGRDRVPDRLRVIHELARQLADRVATHECRLEEILRMKAT
jgi:hypothetical protein